MFDPSTDPLGIGVGQRARERRLRSLLETPGSPTLAGPLADPRWDAYFQAADEAAGEMPVKFGGSTYSPEGSNQLTGFSVQPALQGLKAAVRPRKTSSGVR